MPELPEIETIKRDLATKIVGLEKNVRKIAIDKTAAGMDAEMVKPTFNPR